MLDRRIAAVAVNQLSARIRDLDVALTTLAVLGKHGVPINQRALHGRNILRALPVDVHDQGSREHGQLGGVDRQVAHSRDIATILIEYAHVKHLHVLTARHGMLWN